MGEEQETKIGAERKVWRWAGVVLAVEAIRLIATYPFPRSPEQNLEMLAMAILIPAWYMWGHIRGRWVEKDLSSLVKFIV